MKPRLLVHVGLPKTGTSDLQNRLIRDPGTGWRNFLGRSIEDPDTPREGNRMHFIPEALTGKNPHGAANVASFVDWLGGRDRGPVIYCSELLSQTPRFSRGRVRDVFQALSEVSEVHVVIVLRPFFAWIESFLNQSFKRGARAVPPAGARPQELFPAWDTNFLELVRFYRDVVPGGRDRVHVLPHDRMVNERIAEMAGFALPPGRARSGNASPSAFDALRLYADRKGMPAGWLPEERGLRLVGPKQVAAWRQEIAPWVDALSRDLGWRRALLDDAETFLKGAPPVSYLDLLDPAARSSWRSRARPATTEASTLNGEPRHMAEDIQEDTDLIYAVSRSIARDAVVQRGDADVTAEAVNAEWQGDKNGYRARARRFVKTLEGSGYRIEKA
jgi:hypothetical protein